jgi:hypothetical protein
MGIFECTTSHNLKPYKMNNQKMVEIDISKKKNHLKIHVVPCVKFGWIDEK